MFKQYLELGGTEIANAARTLAYVDKNAPQIPIPARARDRFQTLHVALGEPEYESPAADDAPWVDPSNPASAQFYGVIPLDVQGIQDSTRTANTTQSIGDGGVTGAARFGAKAIRVKALLVAENKLALDAGRTWLGAALNASECTDHGGSCGGAKLCYFAAEPVICDEWEPTYNAGFTAPVATDVPGSPLVIREPNSDAIFKARLDGTDFPPNSRLDGAILRWGTVSRDLTDLEIESYGPIIRQRTNIFPRPNHLADDLGTFWEGTWTPQPGTDGPGLRPYGRATVSGTASVEQTAANPVIAPAGRLVTSVDLRSLVDSSNVTLELRNPDTDAVLSSTVFLVRDTWKRYSFPVPSSANFYVKLTSAVQFDWTGVVVEAGNIDLPYLDGNTPWEEAAGNYVVAGDPNPQYVVSWLGVPNKSSSRLTWLGQMTVGIPIDADFETFPGGTCDVWPFIDMIQGEFSGGRADFYVRPKVQPFQQVIPYERTMHDVSCIEGPLVIEDLPVRTGGAMQIVEFTLVAGKPSAYSTTEILIHPTTMSALPTGPWPGTDQCESDEIAPIIDPDCVVPPGPPRPPEIPSACIITEPVLYRYWFPVDAASVSLWSDMVPRIIIQSGEQAIRQVRVRAFPNPFDREIDDTAPYRRQLATNPKLGAAVTSWVSAGTGTATGRQTGTGPLPEIGAWYRVTATGAHAAGAFGAWSSADGHNLVLPGETVRPGVWVRSNVARDVSLRYSFLNAADAVIGSAVTGAATPVAANTWTFLVAPADVVAPALTDRMLVGAVNATTATANTNTLDVTGAYIGAGTEIVPTYWDGDTAAGGGRYHGWLGDVNASDSLAVASPVDPCSWCSEFVLSYLPPQTELTVDAILERAFAAVSGTPAQAADTLLYATDGGPMTWPALSCGISYIFAVDVPEPLLDDVTISLELARKES